MGYFKYASNGKCKFRMRVPEALQGTFKKTEFKETYSASNPRQAQEISDQWEAHYKNLIAKARQGGFVNLELKSAYQPKDHFQPIDQIRAGMATLRELDESLAAISALRDQAAADVDEEDHDEIDLAEAYHSIKSGEDDAEASVDAALAQANIYLPKDSPLYQDMVANNRETVLTVIAEQWKKVKAKKVAALDPTNLVEFEKSVLKVSDGPLERPAPSVLSAYSEWLEANKDIRDDQGERSKFDNAVSCLVDFLGGDRPANYITKREAKSFVIALAEYPKNRDSQSSAMPFAEAIEYHKSKGPYLGLTTRTMKVWIRALSRIFAEAVDNYEDQYVIENRFDGLSSAAKGRDSVEKRNFKPAEFTAIFSDEVFKGEYSHQAWLILLLTFHGGRDGEWANQQLENVKQDEDGVWYLDVTKEHAKNIQSIRPVCLHQFILDQNFIDGYVLPLKQQAAIKDAVHRAAYDRAKADAKANGKPEPKFEKLDHWLFPQFTRTGKMIKGRHHPSKLPSAQFSQWFGRFLDKINDDPTISLHSARHSWVSTAANLRIPKLYRTAIVGHAQTKDEEDLDVHDGTYTHRYDGNLTTLKRELDRVIFKGFPYENFKNSAFWKS